ncbi:MAG: hypothetical protein AB7E79_08445 [Rhodospirillaceae bacterium]
MPENSSRVVSLLAATDERIAAQEARIAELERRGMDSESSKDLLKLLQANREQMRARLRHLDMERERLNTSVAPPAPARDE